MQQNKNFRQESKISFFTKTGETGSVAIFIK